MKFQFLDKMKQNTVKKIFVFTFVSYGVALFGSKELQEEGYGQLAIQFLDIIKKNIFIKLFMFAFLIYRIIIFWYQVTYNDEFKLKNSLSRKMSRLTGRITQIYIPVFMRSYIYGAFSKTYGVNQEEIRKNINEFECFNKFFTRKIKQRQVDQSSQIIVSPADSKVLSITEVIRDEQLLLKGRYYKLGELLTGVQQYKIQPAIIESMKKYQKIQQEQQNENENENKDNKKVQIKESSLYQIIFYLNPGDYHRFHSPANVSFQKRIHIAGKLLPVKESYLLKNAGVYENNERVNLFGTYKYGFMSMVFVGALNVGSISLNFDDQLKANSKIRKPIQEKQQIFQYNDKEKSGVKLEKGEEIGKFNMGSTIVMIFEAPKGELEFLVQPGDFVKQGQSIFNINTKD